MEIKYSVAVRCTTFNHAEYIKETMDGFCIQRTSFPFICIIIDDASTDGEPEIIKRYLTSNFDINDRKIAYSEETDDYELFFAQHKDNRNCFFAIILLKYNHYSINKSKIDYYEKWKDIEYMAICEGDDYWISPDKLQKQVSFLDNNRNYTMTCNRTLLFSEKYNKIVGVNYCYKKSKKLSVRDVICRRGLFISTCSIVVRKSVSDNKPDYWSSLPFGDYPLQIASVMKGNGWYFNEPMSVYRIDNPNSWMGTHNYPMGGADPEILRLSKVTIQMLKGFAKDYPQYSKYFNDRIADEINKYIPPRKVSRQEVKAYLNLFKEDIKHYTLRWKIDLLCRKCRIPYGRHIYQKLFTRRNQPHNLWYKE